MPEWIANNLEYAFGLLLFAMYTGVRQLERRGVLVSRRHHVEVKQDDVQLQTVTLALERFESQLTTADTLQQRYWSIEDKNATLIDENNELKRVLDARTEESNRVIESNIALRREIDALRTTSEQHRASLERFQAALTANKANLDAVSRELRVQQMDINNATDRAEDAERKLEASEKREAHLRQQLLDVQSMLETARADNDMLQLRIQTLSNGDIHG